MKKPLESATTEPQEPEGRAHVALRLDQCGDTLSITELCAVLGISKSQYFYLKSHRALPLKPLPHLRFRYAKAQVQRFLERGV